MQSKVREVWSTPTGIRVARSRREQIELSVERSRGEQQSSVEQHGVLPQGAEVCKVSCAKCLALPRGAERHAPAGRPEAQPRAAEKRFCA